MKNQVILLNLFRLSNIHISKRNTEAFFRCLSILETTIPSDKIRKIYNDQYNKIIEYTGENCDRKQNLLLLNLYKNFVELDPSESENNEIIFHEIWGAFDTFIMSSSRKHKTSVLFNEWLKQISIELCCPLSLLNFPDPETIDWVVLFQRGLSKDTLINETRLDERSIREYANNYHAKLSNGVYSIPSVANKVTLELNTSEAGELLFSLCRAYYAETTTNIAAHHKEKIERLSLSVWQCIHTETKTYLKKSYGKNKYNAMPKFYALLDKKVETHNPHFINEVEDAYHRLTKDDANSVYCSIIDASKATISGRPFKVNLSGNDSRNHDLPFKIENVYLADDKYNDHHYISYSKDGSNWKHILRNDIKKIWKNF